MNKETRVKLMVQLTKQLISSQMKMKYERDYLEGRISGGYLTTLEAGAIKVKLEREENLKKRIEGIGDGLGMDYKDKFAIHTYGMAMKDVEIHREKCDISIDQLRRMFHQDIKF